MENTKRESPEGLLYARSADIYLDDFKEPGVALEYYRQALEYGHKESTCLEGIARCYLVMGDREQAYNYYRQCVDAGYFSVTMSINYSFLLVQRGEFEAALSALEKAYALSNSQDVRDNLQKYIDYTRKIIEVGHLPDDPDKNFNGHVERNLPVLRKLDKPRLQPFGNAEAKGCAVMVELRQHPWLEYALRNAAFFLPEGWSILIIHGSDNKLFIKEILDSWGVADSIGLYDLKVNNLTRDDYSNLLKRPDFWALIPTTRTLVFQTDAMFLENGLEKFYEWDYIGAPWNDFHVPGGVGNGGFSLRTVSVMREIAARFGASSPADEMEDIFFARMLHAHGADLDPPARLANRQTAFSFCAEWRLRDMPVAENPLAIHQAWRFHTEDQVRTWFDRAESAYRSSQ
jgi:tetratricopeptide (TPR) repeat protein